LTKTDERSPGAARLQAFSAAALLLPGLLVPGVHSTAQAAEAGADGVNLQFSQYSEGRRDLLDARSQLPTLNVDVVHGSVNAHLADRVRFNFAYTQDTWSGATPVTTAPLTANPNRAILRNASDGVVVAGASPYVNNQLLLDQNRDPLRVLPTGGTATDTRVVQVLSSASPESRDQADFALAYDWDEAALQAGTGISQENDYDSVYGNLSLRLDFNQKLTSVTLGGGYTRSEVNAILDSDLLPYLNRNAYLQDITRKGREETLHGERRDWTVHAALSQVINRETLLNMSLGYTRSDGFLGSPYKAMTVLFVDPAQARPGFSLPVTADMRALLEQRPDANRQLAFSSKLVRYLERFDAALHLSYGYSQDRWDIRAHTLEAEWIQPLPGGWQVAPRLRYYSQQQADFYQTYLVSEQVYRRFDPASPGVPIWFNAQLLPAHFSSDHRLSAFGSLSAGLTLTKEITRGLAFEAAVEYYRRASDLRAGGDDASGYADVDFRIVSAGLRLDLDGASLRAQRRARDAAEHAEHQDAHVNHAGGTHAGHLAAAGVQFGHLLPNAGDFMLAYRYAFSRQAGHMLEGSHRVSDSAIVNESCGALVQCSNVPTSMNMKMHMVDLMYAPTSWLTLMLMPQFMDMDMNLRDLAGRPPAVPGVHEHTGAGHTSGGIGDTVVAGLFRLHDSDGHSLHAGLGVSAPTGEVDLELRRMFRSDGGLMHFDMQTGSGTWDLLPSVTYTGSAEHWQWGAQLSGVMRMEQQNTSGYRLGNVVQANSWASYGWDTGMVASVRGVFSQKSEIHGDFNGYNARIGPMDFPQNQGGRFVDIGVGIGYTIPAGRLAGNSLALEWLQPLRDDVNGAQLERRGALNASWQLAF
jgi:hypothetical protein